MRIYGVTGRSGSGKSTLARLLAERLGCRCIDIDVIGHDVLADPAIVEELERQFGPEIIARDGTVDRKALGALLFADPAKNTAYNLFLWEAIRKVLDGILAGEEDAVVLEWMFLPTTGEYWENCDPKILVTSDREKRREAVLKRDGISGDYFDRRDAAGVDFTGVRFDCTVENDYRPETLEKAVSAILARG